MYHRIPEAEIREVESEAGQVLRGGGGEVEMIVELLEGLGQEEWVWRDVALALWVWGCSRESVLLEALGRGDDGPRSRVGRWILGVLGQERNWLGSILGLGEGSVRLQVRVYCV